MGNTNIIKEIEIAYFRSFYKEKLKYVKNMNIIFGKNDSGKSNIIRALNLFFNNTIESNRKIIFQEDFNDYRRKECNSSQDARKFIYVKIHFNTPESYVRSLGKEFYLKRQWAVSRGDEFKEEYSSHIDKSKEYILKRLINKIRFIHVPAIKGKDFFQDLLEDMYLSLSRVRDFRNLINNFSNDIRELVNDIFQGMPEDISKATNISPPTDMRQIFKSLDFETEGNLDIYPKSLIWQKGDGIKARHIPEILKYISKYDKYDYHIWGFEEPENSLDFLSQKSESERFLELSRNEAQIFMTTHSPYFYNIDGEYVSQYYVIKKKDGMTEIIDEKNISDIDSIKELENGFLLPAIANEVKKLDKLIMENGELKKELEKYKIPVVLVEGKTDKIIYEKSKEKLNIMLNIDFYTMKGASSLENYLKGIAARETNDERYNIKIGIFDYDNEGIKRFNNLGNNFTIIEILGSEVKVSKNKVAYAFLIPIPDEFKECKKIMNFSIENLFSNRIIEYSYAEDIGVEKRVGGDKQRDGDCAKEKGRIPCCYKVKESYKIDFAEKYINSFEEEDFIYVKKVFDIIEEICKLSRNDV